MKKRLLKKGRHSSSLWAGVQARAAAIGKPVSASWLSGIACYNAAPVPGSRSGLVAELPARMRESRVSRLIVAICIACWASLGWAGQEVDLYRVEVLVSSQTEAERNRATSEALAELLVRVSGDTQAPSLPTLAAAQRRASQYLHEFRYASTDQQLQVDGQGLVQQWIRNGSVGQGIALAGDGQIASNQLRLELVRDTVGGNLPLSQNVAQAIAMNRGMGPGR